LLLKTQIKKLVIKLSTNKELVIENTNKDLVIKTTNKRACYSNTNKELVIKNTHKELVINPRNEDFSGHKTDLKLICTLLYSLNSLRRCVYCLSHFHDGFWRQFLRRFPSGFLFFVMVGAFLL
jgi:hypothetical protein